MIQRILKFPYHKKSIFLFGPRQTGKSTLVNHFLKKEDFISIDLLKTDILFKYKANPHIIRSETELALKTKGKVLVFIDEIQKCPELLDEIHWLLEQYKDNITFILTGSSARKLKKASVNMLAGRAWQFFLFPFTHIELGERFDLDNALFFGTLPPIIDESPRDSFRTLETYAQTYLKEEILDEALVRNIGAFSRFLNIAADQSGGIVNYSTIARDTGVSSSTIKGYYQILEDTLITVKLEPYLRSARKRLVMHPKFYLFDTGVINAINGRITKQPAKGTAIYGVLFEHFVILETFRMINYTEMPFKIYHWRSSNGAEVDMVVESSDSLWAIEIKSSSSVKPADLRGLKSFSKDYPGAKPLCVSTCDLPYMAGQIPVIPWRYLFTKDFLNLSGFIS